MNPTDPLTFVGAFDARSLALAIVITAPWLVALGWGRLRSGWLWAAVVAAAVLFPFSIAWVQVPIQQAINALWLRALDLETIRRYMLLVGVPSVAVTGLVQEGVKLLVAIAALAAIGSGKGGRTALAIGAAAGAGYGGWEAFWVFNNIFAASWSWAMVDLQGWPALLGFIERAFAVPLHVGLTALAAYGYSMARGRRSYLVAAGGHALGNYGVLLVQAGVLGALAAEAWGALISVVVIALALSLRWREVAPGKSY